MSNQERDYPAPAINVETQHFWDAAADGKLLVKKCNDCGENHYYPRTICPHCFSDKTEWLETSGKGKIYSYSVMRRSPVPYAIAYVTLEEGVTIMTNLVECDFDALAIGQDVRVAFRKTAEDHALPVFTPA